MITVSEVFILEHTSHSFLFELGRVNISYPNQKLQIKGNETPKNTDVQISAVLHINYFQKILNSCV